MTISIKPTASGSTIEQNGSTILTVDGSGNLSTTNNLTVGGTISGNGSSLTNLPAEVKAWVNYDQVTPTLVASYNVSSVTDNSTGNFTVNFTTSMSGTTYLALAGSGYNSTTRGGYFIGEDSGDRDKTTAHCKFKVSSGSSAASNANPSVDIEIINIMFME